MLLIAQKFETDVILFGIDKQMIMTHNDYDPNMWCHKVHSTGVLYSTVQYSAVLLHKIAARSKSQESSDIFYFESLLLQHVCMFMRDGRGPSIIASKLYLGGSS